MARIVVDPVTRIEGHLRVEAVVENGVITDAFSSGMGRDTMTESSHSGCGTLTPPWRHSNPVEMRK